MAFLFRGIFRRGAETAETNAERDDTLRSKLAESYFSGKVFFAIFAPLRETLLHQFGCGSAAL